MSMGVGAGTGRVLGPSAEAASVLARILRGLTSVTVVDEAHAADGDLTVVLVGGQRFSLEIVGRSHLSAAESSALVEQQRRRALQPSRPGALTALIVVADRLTREAKRLLAGAGISFLDRRGELWLTFDGRTIEATVEPTLRPRVPAGGHPIRGASSLSVALAALLSPSQPPGVREIARASALSHTAISQARAKLRTAHLLDDQSRPVLPELFDAVVTSWELPTATDARLPSLDDPRYVAAGANLDGPFYEDLASLAAATKLEERSRRDPHAGWALTGPQAAAAYGADVVVGRDAVASWIVPQDRFVTATHVRTEAPENARLARLVAEPCRLVVRLRRAGPGGAALAHPLVVAIDLARDPGRGREILRSFAPEGVAVVWT